MSGFLSKISRRGFLQGMTATCAAAAVAGCTKKEDQPATSGLSAEPNLQPPTINETVFEGASPHNCGGGCILRAHVSNGVIKRFTTDDRPEKTYLDKVPGDYLQERVCPRCRGQKGWLYGSNRLTYPLIQTKKRGDLTGFKRVTWEQAAAYFKAKVEKVRDAYGPAAFHNVYSSGMGGGYDPIGQLSKFVGSSASWLKYRDDYSFPEWEHTHRIMHDEESQPKSNDQQDAFNSDRLVIWCYNPSEMFNQQQITWMYRQIKEKGVKVTVIDQHYSRSALYADDFIAPVHATDSAMMLAMVYTALTEYREELKALYTKHSNYGEVKTDTDLRKAVGRYIYGFFDTDDSDGAEANESYTLPAEMQADFKAKAKVGAGMSFSAYVMGNQKDPANKGASIYPDAIGYNARTYKVYGEDDPLRGKKTKAYGQVPKTPEWAEKICGVPAAKIRELTKTFLTENVTCWTMGGQQRNSEGEQVCWMYSVLMMFFLSFGKEGRTFGRPYGKGNHAKKGFTMKWKDAINEADFRSEGFKRLVNDGTGFTDPVVKKIEPYMVEDDKGVRWKNSLVDTSKVNFEPLSKKAYNTIPVFLWLDAIEATNQPKVKDADGKMVWPSRWNDGQIKNLPTPVKFIFHTGGNINVNQSGDTNLTTKIMNLSRPENVDNTEVPGVPGVKMNPNGYNLEFVGLCDVVMTSSARWADLVLPGSMGFERFTGATSTRSPLTFFTPRVSTPPGDAMAEISMGAELSAGFGQKEAYQGNYPQDSKYDFEEWVWRETLNHEDNKSKFRGRDFDGWIKEGMYKEFDDLTKVPNYIAYEAYLKNPGRDNVILKKPNQNDNSVKTAFWTLSGRVEAYSYTMMEEYEMRYYNNIDDSVNLVNGKIVTKATPAGKEGNGRYVYAIPMYIPIVEGRHHDDKAEPHPDPLGIKNSYPLSFHTWHIIYRSHSTFNSSPLTNEVKYYKRDAQGNPAFLKRSLTNVNAGADHWDVKSTDTQAPQVWHDDVYETVWLNPDTAAAYGITEGMPTICESPRGRIKVSAHLSERIRPGVVMIGQGSWYNPEKIEADGTVNPSTIDNGGNANTLFSLRPSRIGQGMTLASDCRIKIYKA